MRALRIILAVSCVHGALTIVCPSGNHSPEECEKAGCHAFRPPLGSGYICVECISNQDCTDPSRPGCGEFQCVPTCKSSGYQCMHGIRINRYDDNPCAVDPLQPSAICSDVVCCGGCNDDSDCKTPNLRHCQTLPGQPAVCLQCTENKHCGGKEQCDGTRCVACQDFGCQCSAPCVFGRFECELPCHSDADCLTDEICMANPGEANTTHGSTRCQRTCTSNQDCKRFNNDVHTCIEVGGRTFCGQCVSDTDCPRGHRCVPDGDDWGKCEGSRRGRGESLVV